VWGEGKEGGERERGNESPCWFRGNTVYSKDAERRGVAREEKKQHQILSWNVGAANGELYVGLNES